MLVDAVGKAKAEADWIVREHLQVEGLLIIAKG